MPDRSQTTDSQGGMVPAPERLARLGIEAASAPIETAEQAAGRRLEEALALIPVGIQLERERLRRAHPEESFARIEGRLRAWLHDDDLGDATGTFVRVSPERLRTLQGG